MIGDSHDLTLRTMMAEGSLLAGNAGRGSEHNRLVTTIE